MLARAAAAHAVAQALAEYVGGEPTPLPMVLWGIVALLGVLVEVHDHLSSRRSRQATAPSTPAELPCVPGNLRGRTGELAELQRHLVRRRGTTAVDTTAASNSNCVKR